MNKSQRIAHNAQAALNKLNSCDLNGNHLFIWFHVPEDKMESIKSHLKAIIELANLPKHDKNHS